MSNPERRKIENSLRINRLIKKLCQTKGQILLRPLSEEPIAVRGKVLDESTMQGEKVLQVSEISAKGIKYLEKFATVQVEFNMNATRVDFTVSMVAKGLDCVTLVMPKVLFTQPTK